MTQDTAHAHAEKKVYGVSNFKNLTFAAVAKHFDVPISIAALSLGVSESYLKRLCRTMAIIRWPYRRIRYLQDKIIILKEAMSVQTDEKYAQADLKIHQLQYEIDDILNNGLPLNKSPAKIKVTGVAKRGRPKQDQRKCEIYESNILELPWEVYDDEEVVMLTCDELPLGFHLKLNVDELASIISCRV